MSNKKLLAIDFFSGVGGTTVGLKKAGFTVIGAIENDLTSIESYRKNHPEVIIINKDIREVKPLKLMKQLKIKGGEIDLIVACPPCQGFSKLRITNKHLGRQDSRNDLIFDFLRFVRYLKPKIIMLENVPGIEKDWRFSYLQIELRRLKYKVNSEILDAANYGIPQRRKRMFLIGSFKEGLEFAPQKNERKTVRDAIGSLKRAGESGDLLHDLLVNYKNQVKEIISLIPKDGGSRNKLKDEYRLKCHLKSKGFSDVYGRMKWDDVSPTITCGCISASKGRFLHPEENRSITLREASLLQGFPKEYYFSLKKGKYKVAQLIGNALPPGLIKEQAVLIKDHLLYNYYN